MSSTPSLITRLLAVSRSRPTRAIRAARASAVSSSSAAGTASRTSPIEAASAPLTVSPVNSSRLVHWGPRW